ncbi:hypothetical protein [Phycicoccus jejuensis]|uniref:hypothetical protein n=1 Tax=Phycicoccus jejuensis TaxID=367299 RepID=UPI00068ED030|nr:hypothetical protein [Phycicoccus jejuensis]
MADRTVRAIFEARVSGARKGMTDLSRDVDKTGQKVDGLTKDLKALDAQQVKPDIDVQIDEAKKRLSDLTRELGELKKQPASPEVDLKIEAAKANIAEVRREIKTLTQQRTEVRIDAGIKDAQKAIASITNELGLLRTLEVTPTVTADIKDAQKRLREARASLRELQGAKAAVTVTADTSKAEASVKDLEGEIGDAGEAGGADAGEGLAKGIIDALGTIPIAGAVVGIGAAIGATFFAAVKDGLKVDASRDLFSARTGLDEATSARFGRAAGEAYSNAYGDSVEINLDTARRALAGGLIDSNATDAEIENVIAKLSGLQDLFEYDIPMSVQAVGNMLKTGLVKDANQAFDLITVASQKVPGDDLLDTLNEYSNQWVVAGLNGEQALGLILQGVQAGARDTDKVADALKELGLRAREGTDPAIQALKDLGLNAKDTVAAFQEGGPRATEAMGKVFDALRESKDEGKNVQSVIANLFGGPGEDLGAALFALDLDTVSKALGGVNGSAGAADRALATMADNSATKIEAAQRNIEVAADGIKGALADAFGDQIDAAADWVSRNREPIIQFFLDIINGAIDAGIALSEFTAQGLEGVSNLAVAFASLLDAIDWIPGLDTSGAAESLRELASAAQDGADGIRTNVPAALEDVRDKVNTWAAPELLKARVHDATVAMAEDMDKFSAKVDESGGTVTINGEKKNAEEVLKILTENIDASDGTVTINGDRVPAADALDRIIKLINRGEGTVDIGGNTKPGEGKLRTLKGKISAAEASMTVNANTSPADAALAALKAKYRSMNIRVSGVSSVGGLHEGGRVPGLYAGGKVPGINPGYDNVLWPLATGGRTLQQPLTGGEMVVNPVATSIWEPLLQAINGGLRPSDIPMPSAPGRSVVYQVTAPSTDAREIVREAKAAERREAALHPTWGP